MTEKDAGSSISGKESLLIALGLAGIIIFAVLLRFYKLGDWGFWIDEIYTLNRALGDHSISTPITERLIGLTFNFYPVSEWSARLVPAIIGILSLPLLFFPIRRIINTRVALIAILLLAVSTVHLFWSQNARYYVALLLFYNLALFAFYLWLESERLVYLGLTFLLLVVALAERQVALFILPVILVYLLLIIMLKVEKPPGMRWRNMLIFFIPIILGGLVILITFAPVFETRFLVHSTNPFRFVLSVINDLGIPLFLLAVAGAVYSLVERRRNRFLVTAGAFVPLILLVLVTPFSLVTSRYMFAALPSWLILAAILIDQISRLGTRFAVPLALLLLAIVLVDATSQDVLYFGYQNGNRADWKGAFNLVEHSMQETDLVVSSRPEIGEYYLGRDVVPSYSINPEDFSEQRQGTWFVLDNQTGNVPPQLSSWLDKSGSLQGVMDVYLPGKLLEMRVFFYQP